MSATPRSTAAAATLREKRRLDSARLSEFPARSSAAGQRSPAQWDRVSAVSAPTPQTPRRKAATEGEQVRPHESRRSASSCAHCLTRNRFEDTAEAHGTSKFSRARLRMALALGFRGPAIEAKKGLLAGRLLRRNFRIAWRGLLQVRIQLCIRVANRPENSSSEQIREKLILPIRRPIAHRGIEYAALA